MINTTASATKAAKGSLKARKTAARLFTVQAVYQAIQNNVAPNTLYDEYMNFRVGMDLEDGEMVTPDGPMFRSLLSGISERWGDLQQMITPRLPASAYVEPLLTSILLCGTFELLAHHDIDTPIIISDYLNITAAFFEGTETKLVNGVLDALAKELRSAA